MEGIQVRKDASGDIHVSLDSSTPCWNDTIQRGLPGPTEARPPPIFEGELRKLARGARGVEEKQTQRWLNPRFDLMTRTGVTVGA
jgi:hypothetical protein